MIVLGAFRDSTYNVFLFLHILAVLVAFAPAWVGPVLSALLRKQGTTIPPAVSAAQVQASQRIYFPALVASGFLGVIMLMLDGDYLKFSQMWVSAAFLVWPAIMAIVWFKIIPAERELAAGPSEAAEKALAQFGGIAHLLTAVMLYLMVFKPGL